MTEAGKQRDRTREILHEALEQPPEQRRAFVEARLQAGETLEDALGLLEEVDELGDFLEGEGGFSAAQAFEPALPERIGKYRVERVLGWGSMGVVYLAVQEAPERQVAVKLLRVDASTETMARRFKQEGQVLASLSHPGIATIYEAGVAGLGAGSQPFLAMEFIDGETVSRYAEQRRLDRRERVELVRRVAIAVAHAHEQGVLHRDLKPENILVRANGEPCVLDFGVAHTAGDDPDRLTMTATGQVIGTLAYMAPEQARGAHLDAAADQFALGAILYELLCGELPYDIRGRLPHQALRTIADGVCRSPSQHDSTLSGDLEAILLTALAPEPVRRYSSVEAFGEDLGRWLAGEAIQAHPPSPLQVLWRCVLRNRALSATIVIAVGAIGAGLAWGAGNLLDLRREGEVSLLFSDQQLLKELEVEATELWPVSGSTLPAFHSWVRRAEELQARRSAHDATVLALEGGGAAATTNESVLGAEWILLEGRALLDSIDAFGEGLAPEMAERRSLAGRIFAETVEAHRAEWRRAAQRVHTDPRFEALELMAQEGLVPLGPDPLSGLEEFALWSTGEVPVRDADGVFEPRAEDALVFILVPGGVALIGAQVDDSQRPNYDSAALDHEGQPCTICLDPFLVSKYEMTQAQWERLYHFNPSDWETGSVVEGRETTGRHPVESMSWEQALEFLPRFGMTLPTEAQWEVAARGGTRWACLAGPHWTDLIGQVSWRAHNWELLASEPRLEDDGYFAHMPVGSLAPNRYGLHDVIGNVWELCLDTYKVAYHRLEHREGDGLVLAVPDGDVSRRGFSSAVRPPQVRVYERRMKRFDGRDAVTGIRPARALIFP